MPETEHEIEIRPRGKVLFINMSPTSEKSAVKIAQGTFGAGQNSTDFPEMMISGIKSPELMPKEESGSLRQTIESTLNLPDIDSINGLVITGSPFSAALLVRERKALGADGEGKGVFLPFWQKELATYIRNAKDRKIPTLGICFGAEMIAEALGGKVKQFPKREDTGRGILEVGYSFVLRTNDKPDPLLQDLPMSFVTITNHSRMITRVPEGAEILARNRYGVQIFRIGSMWGLQFHPEKNARDAAKLITDNRKKIIINEQDYLSHFYDPEIGKQILTNFARVVATSKA